MTKICATAALPALLALATPALADQSYPPSDPHSKLCHDSFENRDYQRAADACRSSTASYEQSRQSQQPGSQAADLYGMYEAADEWLLSDVYLHGGEQTFGTTYRTEAYQAGLEAYTLATLIIKPYPESYTSLADWQRAVALYALRIRGDLLTVFPTMWCEVPRLAADETFVAPDGTRHSATDCAH
ncbi:MAG: hypothetical protein ACLPYS_08815 [Vulcanimicrobiaceae bacterium]